MLRLCHAVSRQVQGQVLAYSPLWALDDVDVEPGAADDEHDDGDRHGDEPAALRHGKLRSQIVLANGSPCGYDIAEFNSRGWQP